MAKTITVPAGLGKEYTYMNWAKTAANSTQGRLRDQAKANGHLTYDSEGYTYINGRYVVAMTSTYGNIGDYVDIKTANGKTYQAIIGEEKSQKKTWYDQNPANMWGHANGKRIVEFITNWDDHHANRVSDGGIISVTNLGKNYLGGDMVSGTGVTGFSGGLSGIADKLLGWIVTTVVIIFIVFVAVWFFLKAFNIKIGGIF